MSTKTILSDHEKALRRSRKIAKFKKFLPLYLLMAFPLLHLIVLRIIPLFGLLIAFQRYSPVRGVFGSAWVGLENFQSFFNSSYFENIFVNTLSLNILNLVFSFPLPILFALVLNEIRVRKVRKAVQLVAYAPHFISVVVVISIMQQIFDPITGVLRFFIGEEAAAEILWMADPACFQTLFIASGVWQTLGWSSVLYTSSLASVDIGLYDAAKVDGASLLQKIRYVDFPCILPVISICLIMAVGRMMNTGFDKVYLMQTSTNIGVSEVIETFVYKRGLLDADFGYSTAVGFFNSVINLVLLIVTNATVKKITDESMF